MIRKSELTKDYYKPKEVGAMLGREHITFYVDIWSSFCYNGYKKGAFLMIRKSELTKDYYKPKEVGAMLGREQRTISNMVRAGKLEAIRTDTNRILIPKDSVAELLSRCGLLLEDDDARRDAAELLSRCGLLLEDDDARRDAIYVRVFSHEQKNRGDLERQVSDIMDACEKEGLDRPVVIRDTGSGLNAKRKGLARLIEMAKNHEIKRVFITNKDRGLDRPVVIRDTGSGLNAKRKGLARLIEMAKNHEIKRVFITNKDRLTRFGYEYLEELFSMADVKLVALQEKEDKDLQEELVDDMMSLLASFSQKLYRITGNQKKKMQKIIDTVPGHSPGNPAGSKTLPGSDRLYR